MGECETCTHWTRNPQLVVPPEYERPKGFWAKVFESRHANWIAHAERGWAIKNNRTGWCRRFPKSEETYEHHRCAEFASRTILARTGDA